MSQSKGQFHRRLAKPKELKLLQRLINQCLRQLKDQFAQQDKTSSDEKNWPSWLWGSKENALSALVKLAQIQIKIVEINQGGQPLSSPIKDDIESIALNEQEWGVIERAIQRRQKKQDSTQKGKPAGVREKQSDQDATG